MKRVILFCLLGQLSIPVFAADRVTVDQLSSRVTASRGERDAKIAGRLAAMELTERLNAAKLAALESALPGPESRRALVVLADQATFLDPPPAEIPNQPAPTFAQQREIISKTIDYVRVMQIRIPNLFATRDTIHFEDIPPGLKINSASGDIVPAQPLHPVSRTSVMVNYRDGQDFIQIADKEQSASALTTKGLSSFGEFGTILTSVLIDLPQGKLAWSHWEQGTTKPAAVFSFSVPKASSHYAVRFCCVGNRLFQQLSGYHGEITVEPENGTILRLTLIADLHKDDPITRADLMVEYAPIELGGRTYFCPARSVSISLAPASSSDKAARRFNSYGGIAGIVPEDLLADSPMQIMLNEVVFNQYHLFRSESRVLTADNSTPPSNPDTTANTGSTPHAAAPPATTENSVAAAPTVRNESTTEIAASTAPGIAAPLPAAPSPVEPATLATPELRITPQQTPSLPDVAPGEAKFSLRVTTRIVEVSVAAFDKKGQPVADLKREDFEIFDGGRQQIPRSFGRATVASSIAPVSAAAAQPAEYTNRVEAADGAAQSTPKPGAESATVIFFDATSLQFNDLINARQQVRKILGTLPPSEPVGLYVRIGFGFRVLLEATTDRPALTAAIEAWKPDARDVARAQEAEERNRQQFDTLRSPNAVNFTYAMVGGFGGGPSIGLDPKLLNLGEEPTREALSVLVAVATHMGAIPGHKNLVWIASDNVLADWSDQSAGGDEGRMSPNSIGAYGIRTQEALNNAHVSLYPFDASQLETDATDASLQNDGVQLDPSVKDNYPGFKAPPGGRTFTQLRTQTHPVQIAMQQLAQSTGGRAFGRSSNVVANLNRVIADSKAIYLLSFSPDTQPDDKYHQIKVTVSGRRDIMLRYRTGYLYSREPATLKDRFVQVLWQPFDASEIFLGARRKPATGGAAVALKITTTDVGLVQNGDRWTGKLDIFLVQRDDSGAGAQVKEQTLALDLSAASYDRLQREGIPFEQYLDKKQNAETVRIIVVDENSGRIGSITLPAATERANQ